jgi:LytS/YehU family sensor histidine kinase
MHTVASVVFAATHVLLLRGVSALLRAGIMGVPVATAWNRIGLPERMHIEWEVTTYWALVGLAHALAFSRDAHHRALTAAGLETKLARAQLQVLQQQLRPHFLFNTLQSISALIHRDPVAAGRMIERLADLLRLTLSAGDAAEVPLRQELEHTRHHLEIEQVNMGARLRTAIVVAPDVLECMVPSLLLQPLAENAIRHGLAPRAGGE